jgi:uncharacterized membrane protein
MIKRGFVVLFVMLLIAGIVAAQRLGVHSIRYDEVVKAGDEMEFFVSVINQDNHDVNDVHVEIMAPEGPDILSVQDVDEINAGDTASFILPTYVPRDSPPGDYYVRFSIGDGDEPRVVYRIVTVI